VEIGLDAPLSRLRSFAVWLPKHAALVSSITITSPLRNAAHQPQNVDGLRWELHLKAAQQLLQQALQQATAPPAAAAAAGQLSAAANPQQQQPLRLPNISSVSMAGNAGMLAALPAHSLTHLTISELLGPIDSAAASAAIARLSNLQQLHLSSLQNISDCCLVQLTQLTLLELDCSSVSAQKVQQLLAQPLQLRVLHAFAMDRCFNSLDLSHLMQLQEYRSCWSLGTTVLPPQLQHLAVPAMNSARLRSMQQLQQLTHLNFSYNDCDKPELLLSLAQLPALQSLRIQYHNAHLAAATAAAWPQLPQLRCLRFFFSAGHIPGLPTKQWWEAICSGLAAATSLTRLDIEVDGAMPEDEEAADLAWEDPSKLEPVTLCGRLTGLTNLERLELCGDSGSPGLAPGDALALTALTGLTRLGVKYFAQGVDDATAAAIASSCQQLQHLDLSHCGLGGMACLAAVGRLTQLTALQLFGISGLTQQRLMMLTGLKRLQELNVADTQVTAEDVDSFWAVLRQ
jgi:hypothetical protein